MPAVFRILILAMFGCRSSSSWNQHRTIILSWEKTRPQALTCGLTYGMAQPRRLWGRKTICMLGIKTETTWKYLLHAFPTQLIYRRLLTKLQTSVHCTNKHIPHEMHRYTSPGSLFLSYSWKLVRTHAHKQ